MPARMDTYREAVRRCRFCAVEAPMSSFVPDAVDFALAYVRYRCKDRVACMKRQTEMKATELREIEERRFG